MDVDICGCQEFYELIEDREAAREAFDIKNIYDVLLETRELQPYEKEDIEVRKNNEKLTSKSGVDLHQEQENKNDPQKTHNLLAAEDDYFQDISKVLYYSFFKNFEANLASQLRLPDTQTSQTQTIEDYQSKLRSVKSKLFKEEADLDQLIPSISNKVFDVSKVLAAKAAGKDLGKIQMTEIQKSVTENIESLDPSVSEKVISFDDFIAEKKALTQDMDANDKMVSGVDTYGKDKRLLDKLGHTHGKDEQLLDKLGQLNTENEVQGPESRKGMDKFFGRGLSQKRLENLVCCDNKGADDKSILDMSSENILFNYETVSDYSRMPHDVIRSQMMSVNSLDGHVYTHTPHKKYLPHKKKILFETSDKSYFPQTGSQTPNKKGNFHVQNESSGLDVTTPGTGRLNCEFSGNFDVDKESCKPLTGLLVSNCKTNKNTDTQDKNSLSNHVLDSGLADDHLLDSELNDDYDDSLGKLVLIQKLHQVNIDQSFETGRMNTELNISQSRMPHIKFDKTFGSFHKSCDNCINNGNIITNCSLILDVDCTDNIDLMMTNDISRKRKLLEDEFSKDPRLHKAKEDHTMTRNIMGTKPMKLRKENLDDTYNTDGVSHYDSGHKKAQSLNHEPKISESCETSVCWSTYGYLHNMRQESVQQNEMLQCGNTTSMLIQCLQLGTLSSNSLSTTESYLTNNWQLAQEPRTLPVNTSSARQGIPAIAQNKTIFCISDGNSIKDLSSPDGTLTYDSSLIWEPPMSIRHPETPDSENSQSKSQAPESHNKTNNTLNCRLVTNSLIGQKLGTNVCGVEMKNKEEISQMDIDPTSSTAKQVCYSNVTSSKAKKACPSNVTSNKAKKASHSNVTSNKVKKACPSVVTLDTKRKLKTSISKINPEFSPHVNSLLTLATTAETYPCPSASVTSESSLPNTQHTAPAYKIYPMFLFVKEPSHLCHGSDQNLNANSQKDQKDVTKFIKAPDELPIVIGFDQSVKLYTLSNTEALQTTALDPLKVCLSNQTNSIESVNVQAFNIHQNTGKNINSINTAIPHQQAQSFTSTHQQLAQNFSATSLLMSLIPQISKDLGMKDPDINIEVFPTKMSPLFTAQTASTSLTRQLHTIVPPHQNISIQKLKTSSSASATPASSLNASIMPKSLPFVPNPTVTMLEDSVTLSVSDNALYKLPPCRVCYKRASGLHFGVNSCEACNEFFRRTLKLNKTYHCLHHQNCDVSGTQRNNCNYCRFQKCLSAGMSRERIKTGRYSHKKIALDTLELRQIEDVSFLNLTHQERLEQQILEQQILELNNVFSSASITSISCLDDHREYSLIPFSNQQVETFIKNYLLFVKSLPRFCELCPQDQMTLAKKSWMEFWFFTQFKGADNVFSGTDNVLPGAHDVTQTPQTALNGWQHTFGAGSVEIISKLTIKLRDLNPSDTVLSLMKMITLTSPDCVLLVNRVAVEELNSGYVQCLRYKLAKSAENSADCTHYRNLLTHIMAFCVELRTTVRCLDITLYTDLVRELFKCP